MYFRVIARFSLGCSLHPACLSVDSLPSASLSRSSALWPSRTRSSTSSGRGRWPCARYLNTAVLTDVGVVARQAYRGRQAANPKRFRILSPNSGGSPHVFPRGCSVMPTGLQPSTDSRHAVGLSSTASRSTAGFDDRGNVFLVPRPNAVCSVPAYSGSFGRQS